MAPKKKEHAFDMRETIIKHYLNGDSERTPRSSINSIITKYKKTKSIGNILGRGRKCKTSANVDRIIPHKTKTDRRTSASSVKAELQYEHGITISEQTVRRRLHEVGLFGCLARKKPYVNKANRAKGIVFAKTYPEKGPGFWDTSVKLATDSRFFNKYAHIHVCLSSLSICLIQLGELHLMIQSNFR